VILKKNKTRDNFVNSLYPSGLPVKYKDAQTNFMYNWAKTKGKERHIRDPVIKPLAVNADDQYLSVLPKTSATSAWEHLSTTKKRPSLGDFNESVNPEVVHRSVLTPPVHASTHMSNTSLGKVETETWPETPATPSVVLMTPTEEEEYDEDDEEQDDAVEEGKYDPPVKRTIPTFFEHSSMEVFHDERCNTIVLTPGGAPTGGPR